MTPFKLALVIIFNILSQAWCAEILSKTKSDPDHLYNTIVVGLGASGLGALSKLARRGVDVLGLEASDRIGGRVFTKTLDDGVVELGAEWVHGRNHSVTYDLAVANNISLELQPEVFSAYLSDGSVLDHELVDDLLENCMKSADADEIEAQSLGHYFTSQCNEYISKKKPELQQNPGFVSELLKLMELMSNDNEGSSNWNEVTTKSKYVELDEEYFTMSWHKLGYKTLFDILLNKYNNGPGLPNAKIMLNKEVSQITWSENPTDNVEVKCTDNTTYLASNVIVTLSLGVLKERHMDLFTPKLPQHKKEAIERISMGLLDKVVMIFDEVWWPRDIQSFYFIWKTEDRGNITDEEKWITEVIGVTRTMAYEKALVLWTTGKAAKHVELLSDEDAKRHIMKLLNIFMGKISSIHQPIRIIRTTWLTNPLIRGSYSFDNIETPQHPDLREHLAAPILDSANSPRILFAGEATNPTHFATVHGALETGYREADRLLNDNINRISKLLK